MNPVTVPLHLAIPALLSFGALLLVIAKRNQLFGNESKKIIWISVSVFLVSYTLIVGGAAAFDIYYQWDLNKYDLDGDGFFGADEITSEQMAAMQKLTSDTGRNLAVFTGFIFSALLAVATYLISKVISITF